jgi:triacylglycerol lipase
MIDGASLTVAAEIAVFGRRRHRPESADTVNRTEGSRNMEEASIISKGLGLIADNVTVSALIGLVTALLGTGVFSFLRRPKKTSQGVRDYLTDDHLLTPPMERPAYSDRMAYVLAELSALAYYRFEGCKGTISDATKSLAKIATGNEQQTAEWLEEFADRLLADSTESEDVLREILKSRNFKLLGTFDVVETQGFVCKHMPRNNSDGNPYIVVAFRGTEKKVSDWLTDADAVPEPLNQQFQPEKNGPKKVHSGFWKALKGHKVDKKTALDHVQTILKKNGKDEAGNELPIFFTGHSLGGALALLTTVLIARDKNGACYTYGAPRIANYDFFENVKMPVFRIVNSADIVPRVPPIMVVWIKLVQGIAWLTSTIPPVSKLFEKLAELLHRLAGYRHYGDLRYLTDVKSGSFDQVRLLPNPPAIDRIMWIGQQLVHSWFIPVKSHGMDIYRKKLKYLANERSKTS